MLIPLSSRKAKNLCLSIIELEKGYSVRVVELGNSWNCLQPIPSYTYRDPDVPYEFGVSVCLADGYDTFVGTDVLVLMDKALKQLEGLD